jgi:hypothetical protein
MTRKGIMTAVVVVSSACAGVLASAAQASPVGSHGLMPSVWDCFDVNGNEYTADVSLPAVFNAPGPGASRATFPGILTAYTPTKPGEPALPLGPYQQLPPVAQGNKTGVANGTVLTCTLVNPPIPGVTVTVAHVGG